MKETIQAMRWDRITISTIGAFGFYVLLILTRI